MRSCRPKRRIKGQIQSVARSRKFGANVASHAAVRTREASLTAPLAFFMLPLRRLLNGEPRRHQVLQRRKNLLHIARRVLRRFIFRIAFRRRLFSRRFRRVIVPILFRVFSLRLRQLFLLAIGRLVRFRVVVRISRIFWSFLCFLRRIVF